MNLPAMPVKGSRSWFAWAQAVHAALTSIPESREAAYAENLTGNWNGVLPGIGYNPEGCVIQLEATDRPMRITGTCTWLQELAGEADIQLSIFVDGALVESSFVHAPGAAGAQVTHTVEHRLDPSAVARTVTMVLGNNFAAGGTTLWVRNEPTFPSRLWATLL